MSLIHKLLFIVAFFTLATISYGEDCTGDISIDDCSLSAFDELDSGGILLLFRDTHNQALADVKVHIGSKTFISDSVGQLKIDENDSLLELDKDICLSAKLEGYRSVRRAFIVRAGNVFSSRVHYLQKGDFSGEEPCFSEIAEKLINKGINLYVHFDTDKFTLSPVAKIQALEIAKAMQQIQRENGNDVHFDVIGHTDSRGKEIKNQTLSEKRAQQVAQFILKEETYPLQQVRLSAIGKGESNLLRTGSSDEDHALNRRVEIRMRKTKS